MDRVTKTLLAIVGVMIILSPIGILLVWNYDDAWGEWDVQTVEHMVGHKLPGMEKLSTIWNHAILPDYNIPGWEDKLHASIGYIISAIVGTALVVALYYALVKFVVGKGASS
ncbi:PDGLE domain-containing protein [Thermococcus henrietii]|uniref:PDGLE domain-containing protein n=1 Tax=Thermococcus henrietii TaxID=2016361 RepID=UPI000C07C163|nr:PDGLE domain-containing protein [Thermococcus henrietii]